MVVLLSVCLTHRMPANKTSCPWWHSCLYVWHVEIPANKTSCSWWHSFLCVWHIGCLLIKQAVHGGTLVCMSDTWRSRLTKQAVHGGTLFCMSETWVVITRTLTRWEIAQFPQFATHQPLRSSNQFVRNLDHTGLLRVDKSTQVWTTNGYSDMSNLLKYKSIESWIFF